MTSDTDSGLSEITVHEGPDRTEIRVAIPNTVNGEIICDLHLDEDGEKVLCRLDYEGIPGEYGGHEQYKTKCKALIEALPDAVKTEFTRLRQAWRKVWKDSINVPAYGEYPWAVYQDGWTGADGSDYGMGDGVTKAHETLMAMCRTEEEAKAELDRLTQEAEDDLPKHWMPGNPHLRPTYSIYEYEPRRNWAEQEAEGKSKEAIHEWNLEACGLGDDE